MAYGRNTLGLDRIVAITSPGNDKSIKVLVKLGLRFESTIRLSEDAPAVSCLRRRPTIRRRALAD